MTWIEGDITRVDLGAAAFNVWHDRAVFHFLTERRDRRRYAEVAARALSGLGGARRHLLTTGASAL